MSLPLSLPCNVAEPFFGNLLAHLPSEGQSVDGEAGDRIDGGLQGAEELSFENLLETLDLQTSSPTLLQPVEQNQGLKGIFDILSKDVANQRGDFAYPDDANQVLPLLKFYAAGQKLAVALFGRGQLAAFTFNSPSPDDLVLTARKHSKLSQG